MTGRWSPWRDPAWCGALGLYALNRLVLSPRLNGAFLHGYWNDLLLVPAALPLVLQVQSWLGWRPAGRAPRPVETLLHLVVWSLVCEWIGPRWLGRGTADGWDVACYVAGAVPAQWWWSRRPAPRDPQGSGSGLDAA